MFTLIISIIVFLLVMVIAIPVVVITKSGGLSGLLGNLNNQNIDWFDLIKQWWPKVKPFLLLPLGYIIFVVICYLASSYWMDWLWDRSSTVVWVLLFTAVLHAVLGVKTKWEENGARFLPLYLSLFVCIFVMVNAIAREVNEEGNFLMWGHTYGEKVVKVKMRETVSVPEIMVDSLNTLYGTGKEIHVGTVLAGHRFIIENDGVEYTFRYPGGVPDGWGFNKPMDITFTAEHDIYLTVEKGEKIKYKFF